MRGIEMFGYNFTMDLNSVNSNAIIAKQIRPETEVLEFGPAYGRLTRFLKQEKNCVVDIIEMNEEAGKSAAQFAHNACIGSDEGDIEKSYWHQKLRNNTYDYIVFADVLEHLRAPEKVLEQCYQMLKPNGTILCSIPNIAHASVIIGLLNNDFPYHTTGLLDRTHISFFTNKTFKEMCRKYHYAVVYEKAIPSKVGTNEIQYDYKSVPGLIENSLRFTQNAEAYQYVFGLRKEDEAVDLDLEVDCVAQAGWNVNCFVKEEEDCTFNAQRRLQKKIVGRDVDVSFHLRGFQNVCALQINLIDCIAVINIKHVLLGYADGTQEECTSYDINGGRYGANVWSTAKQIPPMFVQTKPGVSYIRLIYKVVAWNDEIVNDVSEITNTLCAEWKEKENCLLQQLRELELQNQEITLQNRRLQEALAQKNKKLWERLRPTENVDENL